MRRHAAVTRSFFVAVSVGLFAGCHEVTGPVPAGTMFVLVSVGGDPLPTTLDTGPDGTVAIADTVIFVEEHGSTGSVEHHETGQNQVGTFHSVFVRLYEWNNGVLTFHPPPCPPAALCVRFVPETGHLGPETLTITYEDPLVRNRTYHRIS